MSLTVQSQEHRPFLNRTVFNSYLELGTALNNHIIPFTFDINFGARVYDYAFIGLNFSVDVPIERSDYSHWDLSYICIPVGFDIRALIPASRSFYPYLEFSSSLVFSNYDPIYGAKIRAGMGFDIKRFSFGIGYLLYRVGYSDHCATGFEKQFHLGYVKFGVRIGRTE